MLIFTCNIQDRLLLGDEIITTVLDVRDGQARIGIDAPRDIEVHREEVYRRIKGIADEDRLLASAPSLLMPSNRRLFRRKRRIIHNPTPY